MCKSDLVQITYHSIKYGGDGEISGVEVAQIIIQTRCDFLHHKYDNISDRTLIKNKKLTTNQNSLIKQI